jgi:hypothetical protein
MQITFKGEAPLHCRAQFRYFGDLVRLHDPYSFLKKEQCHSQRNLQALHLYCDIVTSKRWSEGFEIENSVQQSRYSRADGTPVS